MTDAIRTWAYLQGVFTDGQSGGSILPSMQRDFVASVLSISASVTAGGTDQGSATVLTSITNVIKTAPASSGVILTAGIPARILNRGANPINIYPPVSGQLEALGTNVAFSLQAGQDAFIVFDTVNPLQGYVSMMLNASKLATALPATTGQLWLNGNVLQVS